MMDKAESNLAEHEFIVGKFYLNRKAPLAALDRFQRIVDRYPHYREMDKIYYYLGRAQLKLGNDDEARVYLDKLLREYPDGEFVRGARRELSKYERQGGKFDLEGSD
jgi:outer membrane protein assembly factor BamD